MKPALGQTTRAIDEGGLTVDATWVLHGGAQNADVVNLAFTVRAPAGSFVHTGDADVATARAWLATTRADVGLVAFWQFLGPDGQDTLDAAAGIPRFVALHVPVAEARFRAAHDSWPLLAPTAPGAVMHVVDEKVSVAPWRGPVAEASRLRLAKPPGPAPAGRVPRSRGAGSAASIE